MLLKTYLQLISTFNNIYIIYNNFNYLKQTRYRLIKNNSVFYFYIIKKLIHRFYIPFSGLL